MNEVVFRGKRIDTGEWVEGYYVKAKDYLDGEYVHIILGLDTTVYPRCEFSSYEVIIPETVGQSTGLSDKNGNPIWEGDIVFDRYTKRPVKFGKHEIDCCGCCFSHHDAVGFYGDYGNDESVFSDEDTWDTYEVIGNVHDNPELLKGCKNND